MARSPFPWIRALVASLALSSCAMQRAANTGDDKPIRAAGYFPLEPGSSWAYLVERKKGDGGTDTLLATTQVITGAGNQFAVQSGDDIATYELRDEGVYKSVSKYFILKDPIQPGMKWPIFNAEGEVRIEAVGLHEEVPAGTFEGCVRVVEEIFEDQRVEWTYAPKVGPIRMRVFFMDGGPEVLILESKLKGFRLGPDRTSTEDG